jgi:hypothetical protein
MIILVETFKAMSGIVNKTSDEFFTSQIGIISNSIKTLCLNKFITKQSVVSNISGEIYNKNKSRGS